MTALHDSTTQLLNECVESVHGAPTTQDISKTKKQGLPLGQELFAITDLYLKKKRGGGDKKEDCHKNILVLSLNSQ